MSKPANILLVNHASKMSGAERGLFQLAARLDKDRFAPTVVLPETGELSEALDKLGVEVELAPLKRLKKTICPCCLVAYLLSMLRVRRRLARLIKDKSVRLIHANSNTAQVYTGPAARRAGIPCIWHSRDLVRLGPLGRWMAARSTRIIATSRAVEKHLESCRPAEGNVAMIHNAVDLDTFSPADRRQAVREKLGVDDNTFLVATIGQLVPWKRHADFIKAGALIAKKLPNARFLVVGADLFNDNPGYIRRLEDLAIAKGVAERITFTGHRTDMPALLEAIDLVIHPASREPFGRAVAEAMAMARPVVAVNACGPAELIEDGVTGMLVPPGSPKKLAEAAVALAQDPKRAQSIGAAARRHIRERFSMPRLIEQVQTLYGEVLNPVREDARPPADSTDPASLPTEGERPREPVDGEP